MTWTKRAFDCVFSMFGLLVLLPLFGLCALAIRMADGGPVLFGQARVGRYGRPFRMWKFRTMVVDASARGGELTIGRDPRVTSVGYWLRKSKLDELPQLLNVLLGEMSFVGPRPEVARYVDQYDATQRRVLDLTPGITDPASLRYRDESSELARAADPERHYVEVIMPDKIRRNLAYAAGATLWKDCRVILQTLGMLSHELSHDGSDDPPSPPFENTMRSLRALVIALLVLAPALQQGAHAQAAPRVNDAELQPGDVVRIVVWRKPELSADVPVGADGSLRHPLYQAVSVRGIPARDVAIRVGEFLKRYETDPQFIAEPLFRVIVAGEVRTPNVYSLPPEATVAQAVAMAGGPTERGQLRSVKLLRDTGELSVDLLSTDPARNGTAETVHSGDRIIVGRQHNRLTEIVLPLASVTAALVSIYSVLTR
ncbi:MAG: glycosyltransferase [Gemmatimonadetes bacterium]|nr:glycosyltransferase [Gemmatimonadota bacterium]